MREVIVEYPCGDMPMVLVYSIDDNSITENYAVSYDMPEKSVINENGITMVPIESIVDFFGAETAQKSLDNITVVMKQYYLNDKKYFSDSRYGWSVKIPKAPIHNIICDNDSEYIYTDWTDGNAFSIKIYPCNAYSTLKEYYDTLLSKELLNKKRSAVCLDQDSQGNKFIKYENSSVEGVCIERTYIKNKKFYQIGIVIKKMEDVEYYKGIIETFSVEQKNGSDVLDLANIQRAINLHY